MKEYSLKLSNWGPRSHTLLALDILNVKLQYQEINILWGS
jgi:hypothetical protein